MPKGIYVRDPSKPKGGRPAVDAVSRFWDKVDLSWHPDGCWEWTGALDEDGYGHLVIEGRGFSSNRAAWTLFKGVVPADLCVCHTCDNPRCVNLDHLWLGTAGENNTDRHIKGRTVANARPLYGEHNGLAKLNPMSVRWIRAARDKGVQLQTIADALGVAKHTVWDVARGKTWQHVQQ